MLGWIGYEYLNMHWKWEEGLQMVGDGFKMSRTEIKMNGSGWGRAENEWEWVKNE